MYKVVAAILLLAAAPALSHASNCSRAATSAAVSVAPTLLAGACLLAAAFSAKGSLQFYFLTFLAAVILIGVVVNNGIVLVDLINRLRAEGMSRLKAVETASRQRMRPILLTSLTTAFGLVPMAIGDAQFVGMPYYPMGRMVLGGILVSMCYTLLLVPLLYVILDDFGGAVKSWVAIIVGRKQPGGAGPTSAD